MAPNLKTLPAGLLNSAMKRIPCLAPFPSFHMDWLKEEAWLDEDCGRPGMELTEFDFDEIAVLY